MRSQEHGQNQLFLQVLCITFFSASLTCLYKCNQHYKRCYSQQRPGIHPGTPHDCVLKEKIETLEQHFFSHQQNAHQNWPRTINTILSDNGIFLVPQDETREGSKPFFRTNVLFSLGNNSNPSPYYLRTTPNSQK